MSRALRWIVQSVALCGACMTAHAASAAAAVGSELFTVAASLCVVVAAIFGCAWLAKRFGGVARLTTQRIRTVAATSVGTRERVVLIEVNGVQLLLGVAPGSVRAIHQFAASEASGFADTLREQVASGVVTTPSIAP